ncbi:MAG: ATP-binding protein [Blastocatellales bacterium]
MSLSARLPDSKTRFRDKPSSSSPSPYSSHKQRYRKLISNSNLYALGRRGIWERRRGHRAHIWGSDGGKIMLLAHTAGAEVVISVADNGCGIAPEDSPHIFEKFHWGQTAALSMPLLLISGARSNPSPPTISATVSSDPL